MALFEWKDEYLLGLEPLDFEHKDLFRCINDLYEQCGIRDEGDELEDCLGQLHARLAAHFALEESAMREMKNPHYEAHKAEHDRFLEEVTEVVASFGTYSGGGTGRSIRHTGERVDSDPHHHHRSAVGHARTLTANGARTYLK